MQVLYVVLQEQWLLLNFDEGLGEWGYYGGDGVGAGSGRGYVFVSKTNI